jgi:N6-adenosine-specific RNA methylase IME4
MGTAVKPAVMSLTFSDEDVARCKSAFPSGEKKYRVIYADPPWEYSSNGNLKEKPYRTMKKAELCAMPVDSICDTDCALFLWTSNPLLDDALQLMKAWGFKFKTVYKVWTKRNVVSGTPAITPGYWSLSSTELLLVGTRGSMQKHKAVFNDRQEFASPRGKHSEKPAAIRDDITKLLNVENRIELFSRHVCDGWDAWGLDVPGFVHYSETVSPVSLKLVVDAEGTVSAVLGVASCRSAGGRSAVYTARAPVHGDVKRPAEELADNADGGAPAKKTGGDRVPVVHRDKGVVRGGARPFRSNFEAWWNSHNRSARNELNKSLYTVPPGFLDENPDIKNIVCNK